MARNVEFDILARDRASQTFDRVGKSSDGLASKIGRLGKGAVMGLGVAAAGAAVGGIAVLGAAMVNGVKDAAAYQTLAAKTAGVLKSTGNASHQSVKGIQARAAALESLSGVDEDLIINGQNVLATFTNIRDGVGKGNKIFDSATKAALNMSTALGTDLQGANIQVGKALNDPIKGITALSRVGVSFTAQQKDQIKTLVKSGDTLGAQKIILKELNKEFGGAAKAAGAGFNGAMARAKDAVGDAFRAIGVKLLPTLTKFADYIATHAGPWIDKLSAGFSRMWKWVSEKLWPALEKGYHTIMPALKEGFHAVVGFIKDKAIPAVTKFVGWIKDDLWPALKKGYETIMPALKQAFKTVADAFKGTGGEGSTFGEKLKAVGYIITTKVIPFIAQLMRVYLPAAAAQLRVVIEVVKKLYSAFQTWRSIMSSVVSFVLKRFADMTSTWATVLRALGHVPGFGWATKAADKMDKAAGKARDVARAIDNIERDVKIKVKFTATSGRIKVGGQSVNVGMYAKGGVNLPKGWKVVGEQGPELMWTPGGDSVIPAKQTRQALNASGGSGSGSGGGDAQPVVVQLVLDGKVIQQSLLRIKRQGGVTLGLA
jgi:hypothetical protein